YYYFFRGLSVLWTGILIFFATMITHHYTPGKTAGTCVLNIVGMGVVVFLGLLFFNMVSMLTEYTVTVYREIVFRL
ncbi:MAG: YIP1 family protein, partial [Bacillota bacterium]